MVAVRFLNACFKKFAENLHFSAFFILGKTSQTLSDIARNVFWFADLKIVFITTTSQIIIFEDNPDAALVLFMVDEHLFSHAISLKRLFETNSKKV